LGASSTEVDECEEIGFVGVVVAEREFGETGLGEVRFNLECERERDTRVLRGTDGEGSGGGAAELVELRPECGGLGEVEAVPLDVQVRALPELGAEGDEAAALCGAAEGACGQGFEAQVAS